MALLFRVERTAKAAERINKSLCQDTRQPGTVLKKLDTRQSDILIEFSRNISLILLRIVDLCLELTSDFKAYFGFIVVQFFELGHTMKSRCYRHLEMFVLRLRSRFS